MQSRPNKFSVEKYLNLKYISKHLSSSIFTGLSSALKALSFFITPRHQMPKKIACKRKLFSNKRTATEVENF